MGNYRVSKYLDNTYGRLNESIAINLFMVIKMIKKLIPNTKGFYASDDGRIFDSAGVERNYYRNGDGYVTASILTNKGIWRTFGVHRLVALAHLTSDIPVILLTVNHIDGNVENNALSNLEYLSVALNNIHAGLLRGCKDRPTILAEDPSGKFEYISNLHVACSKFNCDYDLVWAAIRDGSLIDGYKLTYLKNCSKIPKALHKSTKPFSNPMKAIKLLNIHTQEVEEYKSIGSAAKAHKTSGNHVYTCMSTAKRVCLFKRKYIVVVESADFPVLTQERYEELMNIGGREVIAYNLVKDNYHIYPSAAIFIRNTGLSKKAVTVDLKNGRIRNVGNWLYTYNNSENLKRLKVAIEVQKL